MSDADDWEAWLLAGADDLSLSDDADSPAPTGSGVDGSGEIDSLDSLDALDDPWGALEIALEPLTDDQRAHLARMSGPAAGSNGSAAGAAGPFEALDEIEEIDENDG
jgi:hypothetical protein